MKETDYNMIHSEILNYLDENGSNLISYVGTEVTAIVIANIYVTNDLCSGFGQNISNDISVISSPTRISVIYGGHHSFYKTIGNICQYDDLEDDIAEICTVLDTAISRLRYQLE